MSSRAVITLTKMSRPNPNLDNERFVQDYVVNIYRQLCEVYPVNPHLVTSLADTFVCAPLLSTFSATELSP